MQFNLYKQIIRIKWNYAITSLSHRLCTRHVYIFHSIRLNIRMIIYFTRNIRISFKEEVSYTLGILSIHVRGKLEARMTCQRVEFLLSTAETTMRAQLSFSSQHPPTLQSCCNRAVCDAWSARFLRCLPVDCPQSMLVTSVRSMTHYSQLVYTMPDTWSCTRIIRITFTRVCSPERNGQLTFVLTILDHSRSYYSISVDLGHTKSDRTRSIAPDRECLVNDIIS